MQAACREGPSSAPLRSCNSRLEYRLGEAFRPGVEGMVRRPEEEAEGTVRRPEEEVEGMAARRRAGAIRHRAVEGTARRLAVEGTARRLAVEGTARRLAVEGTAHRRGWGQPQGCPLRRRAAPTSR
jgi:hypothetical protein